MRVSDVKNNPSFQHKILIDIGASNPKGTLKISAITDSGKQILKEKGANLYLNNTVKGFIDGNDFITKLYHNKSTRLLFSKRNNLCRNVWCCWLWIL